MSHQRFKSRMLIEPIVLTVRLQSIELQNQIRVSYHVLLGFKSVITQLNQNKYVHD